MSTSKSATPAPLSPKCDAAQWSDFTTVAQELADPSSSPLPNDDQEISSSVVDVTKTADPATPSFSSSPGYVLTINSETGSVRPAGGYVTILPPPASPKTPE
jgi:hypothetical protein